MKIIDTLRYWLNPPPVAPLPSTTDADLRMARGVQQAILDLPVPEVPGIKIAKLCEAASSVGGDFMFFHSREKRQFSASESGITGVVKFNDQRETFLSVGIGDVAGHGVSSALVMALTSGLLTEVAQSAETPSEILIRVNTHLAHHIEQSDIRYVTCIYLTIFPKTRRIVYSRAGHPPAFIVRQDLSIIELDSPGLFLGMYPDETYTDATVPIQSGDRLIIFSDGITEIRNTKGEEFGTDRLKELVQNTLSLPLEEVLTLIKKRAEKFGPLFDDQTIVAVDIN